MKLLSAAVEAYAHFGLSAEVGMTISAGLFMPEQDWKTLKTIAKGAKGLKLRRWIPDLEGELRGAQASVSQCGYNTALALLRSRVPALVIPYSSGVSDTEQICRARKMEQKRLARVLVPERVTGQVLAAEIRKVLEFKPAVTRFDMNGARNALKIIQMMMRARSHVRENNR